MRNRIHPDRRFANAVTGWYRDHRRDLPWRHSRNPYFIWLSEVILQQTRVEQGLEYYRRFIKAFPTAGHLAAADEAAVLKLWQGLGYYSRARNLHAAARQIMQLHGGKFPRTYTEIRALKGVGDYTAAAIAAFAFRLPHAVVDGNVYRLLSRYLGIRTPVDSAAGKKEFAAAARLLMGDADPHEYNQAVMEFGALQCRPRRPDCPACPLRDSCVAFERKWVNRLPVKKKKQEVRPRYLHYFHVQAGRDTLLRQRTADDIWKSLYEFPMEETARPLDGTAVFRRAAVRKWFPAGRYVVMEKKQYRHLLSHQVLHASFYKIRLTRPGTLPADVFRVNAAEISRLPVHRLMEKYLEEQVPGNSSGGIPRRGRK